MKKAAILSTLVLLAVLAWTTGPTPPKPTTGPTPPNQATGPSPPRPTPMPLPIPPSWPAPQYDLKANPPTREGFTLGRKLFYDPNLSRDSTLSCAGCHQQFGAFATFNHPLSHGIGNTLTTRNAPALQNLAWTRDFMWDGGIKTPSSSPKSSATPSSGKNAVAATGSRSSPTAAIAT